MPADFANVILVVILVVIVGAALLYIRKQKKKGIRCIGCPQAGSCSRSTACGSVDIETLKKQLDEQYGTDHKQSETNYMEDKKV